uniref:Uncharacterized protein n=1 Tax=Aegilops tauschii TaxID=37682 RepID=M8BRC1_AEGTA
MAPVHCCRYVAWSSTFNFSSDLTLLFDCMKVPKVGDGSQKKIVGCAERIADSVMVCCGARTLGQHCMYKWPPYHVWLGYSHKYFKGNQVDKHKLKFNQKLYGRSEIAIAALCSQAADFVPRTLKLHILSPSVPAGRRASGVVVASTFVASLDVDGSMISRVLFLLCGYTASSSQVLSHDEISHTFIVNYKKRNDVRGQQIQLFGFLTCIVEKKEIGELFGSSSRLKFPTAPWLYTVDFAGNPSTHTLLSAKTLSDLRGHE